MNKTQRDSMHSMDKTFYALNRKTKVATVLAFDSWEQLQGAFRVGIRLPDGSNATGIGRCRSLAFFIARARKSGFRVLHADLPEPHHAPRR